MGLLQRLQRRTISSGAASVGVGLMVSVMMVLFQGGVIV